MKYIDADLLRKEIERHLERATAEQEKFPDMPKYRWYLREGKKELCNDLLDYMYDTLGVEEPITDSLQQEQNSIQDTELTGFESALFTAFSYAWQSCLRGEEVDVVQWVKDCSKDLLEAAGCQQEQQEVDLDEFTKKMDARKARYNNYPDNIIVNGTMAFTARMFYMYPNVARKWYDSLPKVTLD